jgi:cation transporter-like permease
MLVLHYASVVLQHKSLVHHPLQVLKVSNLQSIAQSTIQAIQETFLLLLIGVDLMRGIAGQLSELSDILVHRHGPLFQILKPFLLQLDHSLGSMMCTESSSEFRPVDALGFLMGFHVSIPPVGCRTR